MNDLVREYLPLLRMLVTAVVVVLDDAGPAVNVRNGGGRGEH